MKPRNKKKTDILIVGGGPAGLAAALSIAENSPARVLIVDDNPFLGGQIWRAELGKTKSKDASRLIGKIRENKIRFLTNAQVFARSSDDCLLAETPSGTFELFFEKLILATGARERFLPFPNWTLPNIFGAGGLQALVKSGLPVKNKRIVVAGTGPLLLAVAEYLSSKGASVLLIAEQAGGRRIFKFGRGLLRHPTKLAQAAALRVKLAGVPYFTDCFVSSADGEEKLLAVNLIRKGKNRRVECDYLACGFHLVPNIELPTLFGCKIVCGFVFTDEYMQTTEKNIFCAGEPTGIGGIELALLEGKIAGLAAVGLNDSSAHLIRKRNKLGKFTESLNKTFELRPELRDLSNEETIVCRCEDVSFGEVKSFTTFRQAKLQVRCGMGACQGRICGAAGRFLFDWEEPGVRPPIFPVKLENL